MCILGYLRLKIIYNKSIEAIELSKIPCDIWGRVALSEIIPHTDFGRRDVVKQPPISRSYLRYWAYRIYMYIYIYIYIYIGGRSDRYGYIYIYIYIYIFIFPGAGAGDYRWNLIFFSFFISHSQHCLKICVACCWWNQLSIFEHIFYSKTSLAFPKFIRW